MVKKVHIVIYSRYSEDTAEFIKANLNSSADLTICGALDGLNDEQLREMVANPISKGVPVELNDGSWIYVAHDKIERCAKNVINGLQAKSAESIMMCCTLPWPSLEALPGVICPSRVLESNAIALMPKGGTLGLVQPIDVTKDEEVKHWRELGVPVVTTTISPEENTLDELASAAQKLVAQGADLIVLDCLAFTRKHWLQVREVTGKPVLLPMSVLGKLLDEAYG